MFIVRYNNRPIAFLTLSCLISYIIIIVTSFSTTHVLVVNGLQPNVSNNNSNNNNNKNNGMSNKNKKIIKASQQEAVSTSTSSSASSSSSTFETDLGIRYKPSPAKLALWEDAKLREILSRRRKDNSFTISNRLDLLPSSSTSTSSQWDVGDKEKNGDNDNDKNNEHDDERSKQLLQRGQSIHEIGRQSVKVVAKKRKKKAMTTTTTTDESTSCTARPKAIEIPYDVTFAALQAYYKKNANLDIPRRFIIPKTNNYPKILHGVDLSGTVYDMRWWQLHIKQKPTRVAELNQLGFVWERLQPEWNLVLEALITYGTMYKNLLVPTKFVVPHNDPRWPRATWGIHLGNTVYRIRIRGDFLKGSTSFSRTEQLNALGFVWDIQEYRFQLLCQALQIYQNIEAGTKKKLSKDSQRLSTIRVPSTFVVPENDLWPKELWRYPLGAKCIAVRQKELYVKDHPERLKILVDLGLHLGGNDSLSWLEVVHAAAIYSRMNQRKLDVPLKFVVPAPPRWTRTENDTGDDSDIDSKPIIVGSDEAWPWPEYLWGFPLGQRLKDIRARGTYLKGSSASTRRRQLDGLGFVWEPKRGRPRIRSSTSSTTTTPTKRTKQKKKEEDSIVNI